MWRQHAQRAVFAHEVERAFNALTIGTGDQIQLKADVACLGVQFVGHRELITYQCAPTQITAGVEIAQEGQRVHTVA